MTITEGINKLDIFFSDLNSKLPEGVRFMGFPNGDGPGTYVYELDTGMYGDFLRSTSIRSNNNLLLRLRLTISETNISLRRASYKKIYFRLAKNPEDKYYTRDVKIGYFPRRYIKKVNYRLTENTISQAEHIFNLYLEKYLVGIYSI